MKRTIIIALLLLSIPIAVEAQVNDLAFQNRLDILSKYLHILLPSQSWVMNNLNITGVLTAEEVHFTNLTVIDTNITGNLTVNGNLTVLENSFLSANVGIGTATPGTALEVNGDILARNLTIVDINSVNQMNFDATTEDKVSYFANRLGLVTMFGVGVESNTLYWKTGSAYRWYVASNADGGSSDTMELTANTLTMNGRLGVGTTPSAVGHTIELPVDGSIGSATGSNSRLLFVTGGNVQLRADDDIQFFTSGVRRMHIDDTDGFIGIGTATPTETLDVVGFANYQTPLGGFHSNGEAGVVNVTLTASDTMFQVTGMFESSVQVGNGTYFTNDATNGNITMLAPAAGIWEVTAGGSFSATRTGVYHCWVTNNGTKQEVSFQRSIGSINQFGFAEPTNDIIVTSGDVLAFECETSSGANPTLSFTHFTFKIERASR